jgi:CBS domain-containing protein
MATVKEILDKKGSFVACVEKGVTVLEATKMMNEKRIGALVICDKDKVAGIFTERDILVRVVAAQIDPATTPVEKVMTTTLACCMPETTLDECKEIMTEKRIRHLPVVKDQKLLGIITSGDVLYQEKKKGQQTIQYLKEYIQGPFPDSSS